MIKNILVRISFLIGSTSFADDFQISAYGPDLGQLQRVKNCLDYSTCQYVQTSVAGGENGVYRYHSFITGDENLMQNLVQTCALSSIGFKVSVTNITTKKPVVMIGSQPLKTLPMPIDLQTTTADQRMTHYKNIKALIDQAKYDDAIKYILQSFNIPTGGYQFAYNPKIFADGAITDHDKKLVSFGLNTVKDVCFLPRAVRHEAEHVLQIKRLMQCNGNHAMIDHINRERSAYLNDHRNVAIMCSDPKRVLQEKEAALYNFEMAYTRK